MCGMKSVMSPCLVKPQMVLVAEWLKRLGLQHVTWLHFWLPLSQLATLLDGSDAETRPLSDALTCVADVETESEVVEVRGAGRFVLPEEKQDQQPPRLLLHDAFMGDQVCARAYVHKCVRAFATWPAHSDSK